MKCKAFDAFIKGLYQNPTKAKDFLSDKRLTALERKIIEGYLLIRDSKFEEATQLLGSLPESPIDFARAHRFHVLGIAENMLTHFTQSISYLEQAIALFDEIDLPFYRFMGRFNLFMAQSNLHNLSAMVQLVKEMELLPKESELLTIRLLRCRFILADDQDERAVAENLNREIHSYWDRMSENDRYAHLVSEYMFHTKVENFQAALTTLGEMKKFRKYSQAENFNYMKKLLEHHLHGAPLYAYERDFNESPRLYHQIMLIQALETQELEVAHEHWQVLKEAEPQNFGDPFQYKGKRSIFSICLDKLTKTVPEEVKVITISGLSKTDHILRIFSEATAPIQKHQLFEVIWGYPPESKEDILKLSKLVSSIREKTDFEIRSRKGIYTVVKPVAKRQNVS